MNKKYINICMLIIMFFVCTYSFETKVEEKITIDSLINIDEYTIEEYKTYSEEINKIKDNKENILIVISSEAVEDENATSVVKGPNNQYFVEYDNETDRKKGLEKFKEDENVLSANENGIYTISSLTYNSWGIEKTGLDTAISVANTKNLEDVVVAIIDTGLDVTLFNSNYTNKLAGTYNLIDNKTMYDGNGHGTHIAGTIAEGTPNNVKILPYKVSDGISIRDTDIIEAINHIIMNNSADVINMSFTSYVLNDAMQQAITAANMKNIVVVAAAGNETTSKNAYPASLDTTISVSAVNYLSNLSWFSNYGSSITFAAPGESINSINGSKNGTSMAAPHVAAAVGILKGYDTNYNLNEVVDILKYYATDIGDKGRDNSFGYGLINLDNLVYCTDVNCVEPIITDKVSENITKIEAVVNTPSYNYNTISNLDLIDVKLFYNDTEYSTVNLLDLDNYELINYDVNSSSNQSVTLKYLGLETTFNINDISSLNSVFEYNVINASDIEITGYKENLVNNLYIPEIIDGYNVVSLGDNLFQNNNVIEKVYLSSTVNSIGNNTFENSTSLNSVILNDTITSIGSYTFAGTNNLVNIVLPNSITNIGEYAFSRSNLKSIDLPDNLTNLSNNIFEKCVNLETVNLPDTLESIGDNAFASTTNLRSINIPENVTVISNNAFINSTSLELIEVDLNNSVYDSRDSSNAIIETSTNKLIVGSSSSNIPNSVEIIGSYAFAYDLDMYDFTVPEGVTTLEGNAFYESVNLQRLVLPNSLTTIGTDALKTGSANLYLWLFKDSYAKTYAENNNMKYFTFDPASVTFVLPNKNYEAFDTVDLTGAYFNLTYDDSANNRETLNENITVKYPNNNSSLRYGDTYVEVSVVNSFGYTVKHNATITVSKINPSYTIPTGLNATVGDSLSDVSLPSNFEWMDDTVVISSSGNQTYLAKYVPTDTNNYNIIENINVTINVGEREIVKTVVNPIISIDDKIYNGNAVVDESSINVTGLNASNYTIEYINTSMINVGFGSVLVRIKLTDDYYLTHSFDNNLQIKDFNVNLNVVPLKVNKVSIVSKEYIYDGNKKNIELNNFNSEYMNISGNDNIDAGSYALTISLKNNNYIWSDNTSDNIVINYEIKKASVNYVYTSSDNNVIYNGLNHGINLNVTSPSNVKIKYANELDEYILDDMPKYINEGNYVIKYKLYINDNYEEEYGSQNLNIAASNFKNNTVDYEVNYDGNNHKLVIDLNISDYDILYSVNNLNYDLTEMPSFKEVGEYTINYKITKDNNVFYGSNKLKIFGIKSISSELKIDSNILIVSNYITSFSNIKSKINIYSPKFTISHYNSSNQLLTSDLTKTGDKINIDINNIEYNYTISILGDVNGDGKVSSLDYVRIKNNIMGTKLISGKEYLVAGDVNSDGKISSLDYVRIKNYIMEGN